MAFNPVTDLRDALKKSANCDSHPPLHRSRSVEEAELWKETVEHCSEYSRQQHLRWLALNDLFYFVVHILNRKPLNHPWILERCCEVEDNPDGYMDLWAREHGKSAIITIAKTIQDIIENPNETVGIFSHSRPMAKKFLKEIKTEFETNLLLKSLFPDVLYNDPENESSRWTNDAIILKRTENRKEATVEAWGLVDNQPTGARFSILVYDDVTAREQITENMARRTTEEFENSLLCSTSRGAPRFRYIGTYQELNDTTHQLMERGFGTPRIHPAINGKGDVVYLDPERFQWFRDNLSPKVFALNLLLDPKLAADNKEIGFHDEWLKSYETEPNFKNLNIMLLCDPAGAGRQSRSKTAMWVIGLGSDRSIYILDGVLDTMNLPQRRDAYVALHRKWWEIVQPHEIVSLYESYGMQGDLDALKEHQDRSNYHFTIKMISESGARKADRINRLSPWFENHKILMPGPRLRSTEGICFYTNLAGKKVDLINELIKVYTSYPTLGPWDQLDALSQFCSPLVKLQFPKRYGTREPNKYWGDTAGSGNNDPGGWMAG